MSTWFLPLHADGAYVPQFQILYICYSTVISQKHLVEVCHDVYFICWINQDLKVK